MLLLCGGIFGVLCLIPYMLALVEPMVGKVAVPPLPVPVLVALMLLQNTVILAVLIGTGLVLARKVGLGAPFLQSWLAAEPVDVRITGTLRASLAYGVGVGVSLWVLILLVSTLVPSFPTTAESAIPIWKRLGACFYGGITEELLMRLFVLSFIAWILGRFAKTPSGFPTGRALWAANIAAALLFGVAHLPAAAMFTALTPSVVAIVLLLNGIGGVVFGYLYLRNGLEAAMLSHFAADLCLHVVGPALIRS